MGASEEKQILRRIQWYLMMAMARVTPSNHGWKKIGETRITSKEGNIVSFQVFETPDGQLGFQRDGDIYQTEGDNNGALEFVHGVQNAPQK